MKARGSRTNRSGADRPTTGSRPASPTGALTPEEELQQTAGNEAVTRLLAPGEGADPPATGGGTVGGNGNGSPADIPAAAGGRPLPPTLRARMEETLGSPLESVRVFDGDAARQPATLLGARAFAENGTIWLGEGESVGDETLMAHELAHVIQQRNALSSGLPDASATLEGEARGVADAAAAGRAPPSITGSAPATPQRQDLDEGFQSVLATVDYEGSGVVVSVVGAPIVGFAEPWIEPGDIRVEAVRGPSAEAGGEVMTHVLVHHPPGVEPILNEPLLEEWRAAGMNINITLQSDAAPFPAPLEEGRSISIELEGPREFERSREWGPRRPASPPPQARSPRPAPTVLPQETPQWPSSPDLPVPAAPSGGGVEAAEPETVPRAPGRPPVVAEARPPTPDPQVEKVLERLKEGRWDVDTLAGELTEDQMAALPLEQRVALIRYIATGFVVFNPDEATILKLLKTTPEEDIRGLMKAMEADGSAMMRELEAALDFDDYKQYHILLASLYLKAKDPSDFVAEAGTARTLIWRNPGPVKYAIHPAKSYIESAELTDEGKVKVRWWRIGLIIGFSEDMEFDATDMVCIEFPIGDEQFDTKPGDVLFLPAVSLLALHSRQFKDEMMLVGDVAAVAGGGVGLATAPTKLRAIIAAVELAYGLGDPVVRDFRTELSATEEGRDFLRAWTVVQTLMLVYGGYQALRAAPEAFRALRGSLDELAKVNHGLDPDSLLALQKQVETMADEAAEFERLSKSAAAADVPIAPKEFGLGPVGPQTPPRRAPAVEGEPPAVPGTKAEVPEPPARAGTPEEAPPVTAEGTLPPGEAAKLPRGEPGPELEGPPGPEASRGKEPQAPAATPEPARPPGPASSRTVDPDDLAPAQREVLDLVRARPGLARLSDGTVLWLHEKGLFGAAARRSFARASDSTVRAIERFAGEHNFERVVSDWLQAGPKQEGARWVMRAGYELFGDLPPGSVIFEGTLATGAGGRALRITDVMAEVQGGMLWEFKNVSSLRSGAVKQLLTDLVLVGYERGLGQLDSLRWVFNAEKMARAGISRADVIQKLQSRVGDFFTALPPDTVAKIRDSIPNIIIFK